MGSFSKVKSVLLGLGGISAVTSYYYLNQGRSKAYASWTSNIEYSLWDDNWDHRSPNHLGVTEKVFSEKDENRINNNKEKYRSKVCRHIILIRHGQYNLDGMLDSERILTKLGRLQAEHTGKRLKSLNLPYTEIVKSTMSRAQETGSIIEKFLPNVPVQNCDFLREGEPIPPQPPAGNYRPEDYVKSFIDGARIEAAFRKYFYRADASQTQESFTVLVCHGNVIRYFVCRALQFPPEAWLRISLKNGSITWITIAPNGHVALRTLGDAGFMPPECLTTT